VPRDIKKGIRRALKRLRAGRLEDLMDRLRELGEISSEFAERIKTLDTDSLKKWNRLAARAESMEAFLEQIKEQ